MKNEKIIINIKGFVNTEGNGVIASMLLTNKKKNDDVYAGGKMWWKAIGCALYASTEMRNNHEFCVPYF